MRLPHPFPETERRRRQRWSTNPPVEHASDRNGIAHASRARQQANDTVESRRAAEIQQRNDHGDEQRDEYCAQRDRCPYTLRSAQPPRERQSLIPRKGPRLPRRSGHNAQIRANAEGRDDRHHSNGPLRTVGCGQEDVDVWENRCGAENLGFEVRNAEAESHEHDEAEGAVEEDGGEHHSGYDEGGVADFLGEVCGGVSGRIIGMELDYSTRGEETYEQDCHSLLDFLSR